MYKNKVSGCKQTCRQKKAIKLKQHLSTEPNNICCKQAWEASQNMFALNANLHKA